MAISNKVVMAILAPFAAIVAKLAGAINGFGVNDRQNGQTSYPSTSILFVIPAQAGISTTHCAARLRFRPAPG
ncbi:MAG: hypothetical protein JHD35_12640 [Sphingopyxis sp.]|nr:hypothetical protein [Sphingopyxis sp.]